MACVCCIFKIPPALCMDQAFVVILTAVLCSNLIDNDGDVNKLALFHRWKPFVQSYHGDRRTLQKLESIRFQS